MPQAKPGDTRLGDPEENRKTIYPERLCKEYKKRKGRGGRRGRKGKLARRSSVCVHRRELSSRVYPLHTFHFSAKSFFPRNSAPSDQHTGSLFPTTSLLRRTRTFSVSIYLNKNTASVPRGTRVPSKQCNEIAYVHTHVCLHIRIHGSPDIPIIVSYYLAS